MHPEVEKTQLVFKEKEDRKQHEKNKIINDVEFTKCIELIIERNYRFIKELQQQKSKEIFNNLSKWLLKTKQKTDNKIDIEVIQQYIRYNIKKHLK